MNPWQVEARRSGDWWALSVPQLPGVHSQCRRFREAASMSAEAIALFLDVDPTTIVTVVSPILDGELTSKLRDRARLVDELAQQQATVAHTSRELVVELHHRGFTQRDTADVMGISFQRVNQLLNGR